MYNFVRPMRLGQRVVHKPVRGSILDLAHPLTHGLIFYTNFIECTGLPGSTRQFNIYDHITRFTKVTRSATLVTVSPFFDLGPALNFTGATNSSIAWVVYSGGVPNLAQVRVLFDGDNDFTVAAKFRSEPTGGVFSYLFDIAGGVGTSRWILGTSVIAADDIGLFVGDTGAAATVNTYADGNWYTAFGRRVGTVSNSIDVYNTSGFRRDSVTVVSAQGPNTGSSHDLAIGSSGTANQNGWAGNMEWAGIWSRVLSDSEMQSLSSNPYQIMVPLSRSWFQAVVAADTLLAQSIM